MKEITGTIDHRILLNYRIDPEVMKKQLPPEFTPKIVNGYAIGGICQVSLSNMRPKGLPAIVTTRSHNAAHRIAVVSSKGEGVYVTRRDTNSRLNTLTGGKIFPGVYRRALFEVDASGDHYAVKIIANKGIPLMTIDATVSDILPNGSIFESSQAVSAFFEGGSMGWSTKEGGGFDAIELRTPEWRMEPMKIQEEYSAYFSDETKFPKGSVTFDSAMIIRNLKHSWVSRKNMCEVCC